jgi:hypothetical protein
MKRVVVWDVTMYSQVYGQCACRRHPLLVIRLDYTSAPKMGARMFPRNFGALTLQKDILTIQFPNCYHPAYRTKLYQDRQTQFFHLLECLLHVVSKRTN